MEQGAATNPGKSKIFIFAAGLLLAAAGASGWFYYSSRMRDLPPPPAKAPPGIRPVARIVMAPQPSGTPAEGAPSEPLPAALAGPDRIQFEAAPDPLKKFRADVNEAVAREVSAAFPQLRMVLDEPLAGSNEAANERTFLQLLEAAEKAPPERRPVILLAADLVGEHLGCEKSGETGPVETRCPELRSGLARYQITLQYDQLGLGVYYARDLLWRVWGDYPATDWGQRAFVLLLDRGWDTSATCAKGADQTKEVIHQGEGFLQQRPGSPYRGAVTLLVAEAYASRWSLSAKPKDGMADYVNPKEFHEGAEEARIKAIGYFEQASQLAPGTELSEYAGDVLPHLREKQVLENYRFYCVYD